MRTGLAIVLTAVVTAAAVKVTEVRAEGFDLAVCRLFIEDENGVARAVIAAQPGGEVAMALCDENSVQCSYISESGAFFQDVASGTSLEIDGTGIRFRDATGVLRAQLYFGSFGEVRWDLCDAQRNKCASVLDDAFAVYEDAGGALSQTMDLRSEGMTLAYPGSGNFFGREAASFTTSATLGARFASVVLGARDNSNFRGGPDHGLSLSVGEPTTSDPAPTVEAALRSGGTPRVVLSDFAKALRVFNAHGKAKLQK